MSEMTDDTKLIHDLLNIMQKEKLDFTNTFRLLSQNLRKEKKSLRKHFQNSAKFDLWEKRWRARIKKESNPIAACEEQMEKINPAYIQANHKVEEVLTAAINNDNFELFENMLAILSTPFDEKKGNEDFAKPAPISSEPTKHFVAHSQPQDSISPHRASGPV